MAIAIGSERLSLDGDAFAGASNKIGTVFDLGNGRVVYALDGVADVFVSPNFEGVRGTVGVFDLRSGDVLAEPEQLFVRGPEVPDAEGRQVSASAWAAVPLADGGIRIHYTVEFGQFDPVSEARAFYRNIAPDGDGFGDPVATRPGNASFTAEKSVATILSTGDIAVAHPSGVTVLAPDGSFVGGAPGNAERFRTGDAYAAVEVDGRLLVLTQFAPIDFRADRPPEARFYGLDGTPDGPVFDPFPEQQVGSRLGPVSGQGAIDAAVLADGRTVVVYGDDGRLSISFLGADGVASGPPVRVAPDGRNGLTDSGALAALDDGGFALAYTRSDVLGARGVATVQLYDADGAPNGAPVSTLLAQTRTDPVNTVIGPDGRGLLVASSGEALTVDALASETAFGPTTFRGGGPGGAGDDLLPGSPFADLLEGAGGDDTLLGGEGRDTLDGGPGANLMDGGPGEDVFSGGRGDDTYVLRRDTEAAEFILDRGGVDTALVFGNMEIPFVSRDVNVPFLERLIGQQDTGQRLVGSFVDNEIVGADGSDTIVGFGGHDTMTGGAGADFFVLTERRNPDAADGPPGTTILTDFSAADGDRIAVDDRLIGEGRDRVDLRAVDQALITEVLTSGRVEIRRDEGLVFDADLDGIAEATLRLAQGTRIDADDVLLF